MILEYEAQNLKNIVYDFKRVVGLNMVILDEKFNHLNYNDTALPNGYCDMVKSTARGRALCRASDAELLEKCRQTRMPQYHLCHAGLVDVAVPILDGEDIMGYLILGQLKFESDFPEEPPSLASLGASEEEIRSCYERVSTVSREKLDSIINISVMLAKYILAEKYIQGKSRSNLEQAVSFIEGKLSEPLSVAEISKGAHVSKTLLYKLFREQYNMTVSEYVNSRRARFSEKMLTGTDFSVEKIATLSGFSDAAYYSRIFKKYYGTSPMKYRKRK